MAVFLQAWNDGNQLPPIPLPLYWLSAERLFPFCCPASLHQSNYGIFLICIHLNWLCHLRFPPASLTSYMALSWMAGRNIGMFSQAPACLSTEDTDGLKWSGTDQPFMKLCIESCVCGHVCMLCVYSIQAWERQKDEVRSEGRRGEGYSRYSFLPWLLSLPLRKASCTSPCSSSPLASWVR